MLCLSVTSQFAAAGQCRRSVSPVSVYATYATISSKPSLPACKLSGSPSRKWENL